MTSDRCQDLSITLERQTIKLVYPIFNQPLVRYNNIVERIQSTEGGLSIDATNSNASIISNVLEILPYHSLDSSRNVNHFFSRLLSYGTTPRV